MDEDWVARRALAARVGAKVDLAKVAYLRILSEVKIADPEWPLTVELDVDTSWTAENGVLGYVVAYELIASSPADEQGGEGASALLIEASLGVGYEFPEEAEFTEEELDAFGEINVTFSAYPYFRELVHSLTSRAGFPILTLGVLRSPIDSDT